MSDEHEWSEAERQALARLRVPLNAPANIEARIVGDLRLRGALRSPVWRPMKAAAAAAVLIAALASGAMLDRILTRRSAPGDRFILLLYGGTEDPSRRGEYAAWARSVARSGVDISGEELSQPAEEVWADTSRRVPADPLPRGYFVVDASTLDEARRIASTCPHLQHGGRIVIRAIVSGP
jgi:hypothetical protein